MASGKLVFRALDAHDDLLLRRVWSEARTSDSTREASQGKLSTSATPSSCCSRWADRFSARPTSITIAHTISGRIESRFRQPWIALDPDAKLLELDDGIISFSIESPSIHAFGFASDKDTASRSTRRSAARARLRRGYDIFASNGYVAIDPADGRLKSIRARLRESGAVQEELKSELDSFDLELLWVHEPTRTGFIRFTPAGSAPSATGSSIPQGR